MQTLIPSPVYTEKTECQDCYKCLRMCPLKSIRVEDSAATIAMEDCVFCGICTLICPAKAKRIRNDLPRLKALLASNEEVWLSIAPSYVAEFPNVDPERLVGAIKKLGFAGVSETALGADMVSKEVAKQTVEHPEQKLFISTACPAIVRYIEHYMPEFVPYLIQCGSPLQLHSEFLKKTIDRPIKVVFAGPCAAKKWESDRWSDCVDLSIGFSELKQMFDEAGINLQHIADAEKGKMYPQRAGLGMVYPLDSGMCRSIQGFADLAHPDLMYKNYSGLENIVSTLKGFNPELLDKPLFLELLACAGGCINGPMMTPKNSILTREVMVEQTAERYQTTPCKNDAIYQPQYVKNPIVIPTISPEKITDALHQIGKYTPEDELNCSGCGYDSCRDFARALVQKKAEKSQCVSYMRKLANKKASRLMQSMPSGVIIVNRELSVVECNFNFAKLLGGDALMIYEASPGMEGAQLEKLCPNVIPYIKEMWANPQHNSVRTVIRQNNKVYQVIVFNIEKEEMAGVIMQDCTDPYVRRDRVIEQTRSVIKKNLETVQNIAFLLGENAAESETILNSIIDNFSGTSGEEQE